jgi:hypothetical protein
MWGVYLFTRLCLIYSVQLKVATLFTTKKLRSQAREPK